MSIGLNTNELTKVFMQSLKQRKTTETMELLTAKLGINPETQKLLDEMQKSFPSINPEQILDIFVVFVAFMDTIVLNNESLAKSIWHIDH